MENWWSLRNSSCMHIVQLSERDLEIPHQNVQTDGNLACGWVRATSQTNTLSEQTMELCMRDAHDDSQRTEPQDSHRDPTEAEVDDNR